jgi:hypothetical protein
MESDASCQAHNTFSPPAVELTERWFVPVGYMDTPSREIQMRLSELSWLRCSLLPQVLCEDA